MSGLQATEVALCTSCRLLCSAVDKYIQQQYTVHKCTPKARDCCMRKRHRHAPMPLSQLQPLGRYEHAIADRMHPVVGAQYNLKP